MCVLVLRWGGLLALALVWALPDDSSASEPHAIPQTLLLSGNLHERLLSGQSLDPRQQRELVRLPLVLKKQFAPGVTAPSEGPIRFVRLSGGLVEPGKQVPPGGVRLLPVAPGLTALRLQAGLFELGVVELRLVSERAGEFVDRQSLSISRSLPSELALSRVSAQPDREAVFLKLIGPDSALPSVVSVTSFSQQDRYLDALHDVALVSAPCNEAGLSCAQTPLLRMVVDSVERNHPRVQQRSLVAEVGGQVEIRTAESTHRRFAVAAPDGLVDAEATPGRYRMKIRARLVNMQKGGPPPVGDDVEEAKRIVIDEMDVASRMWGQCGMVLGPQADWDVQVVDPPAVTLLEVGCDGGVRASGGTISLQISSVGGIKKRIEQRTHAGDDPAQVASALRSAFEREGYAVRLYRNAQIVHAALPSYDLLVSDRAGRPVQVEPKAGLSLSNDPTLGVCLGELDLADGLEHFTDFNAAAGTREERMLLRALSDGDPSTIELIVVPIFAGVGRIGESFIQSPGGSLRNALILDRGGIRAGARSLTLAHELGHILLEMPGHPDDFGVDTPTSLMDADAADSTIFGPRRLTIEDCRRALRQSGPGAPAPLLEAWPLD